MQKRSHKLLASTLLANVQGFQSRRYELAFLLGSFQPDCNPLTYLKGSIRARLLGGHNFTNSRPYVLTRLQRLEQKDRWNLWNYYTLGKLTHYVADAFTFPHNEHWPDSLASHHVYETRLRIYLAKHLREYAFPDCSAEQLDLIPALEALHRQYLESRNSDLSRDTRFIVEATGLLMRCCQKRKSPYCHKRQHGLFFMG